MAKRQNQFQQGMAAVIEGIREHLTEVELNYELETEEAEVSIEEASVADLVKELASRYEGDSDEEEE